VAAETRAATVVAGSYYRASGDLEFLVEVTDARSGELLRSIGPVHSSVAVDTLFPPR
jgi:hypothetical protein